MRPGTRVAAMPFFISEIVAPKRRQARLAASAFSWLNRPIS